MSRFKIECDALTEADCIAAAAWLLPLVHPYSSVEAVASTGPVAEWLGDAFARHLSPGGPVLIVDDVLTSGASMEDQRAARSDVKGAVIFARGPCPSWVEALFTLNERAR